MTRAAFCGSAELAYYRPRGWHSSTGAIEHEDGIDRARGISLCAEPERGRLGAGRAGSARTGQWTRGARRRHNRDRIGASRSGGPSRGSTAGGRGGGGGGAPAGPNDLYDFSAAAGEIAAVRGGPPVESEQQVTVGGQSLAYTVRVGAMPINNATSGEPEA